jgi:hypothetical protein
MPDVLAAEVYDELGERGASLAWIAIGWSVLALCLTAINAGWI